MDYFGYVQQKEFELLSEEAQTDFLLSEGIYTTVNTFTLTQSGMVRIGPHDLTERHVLSKIVEAQLYKFVVDRYSEFISQEFYTFQIEFNEKKYGLKTSKQKNIALRYYKRYYNQVATKVINVITQRNLENGGVAVERIPKLEFLRGQQNAMLSNLGKTDLLQQFLFGNEGYFVAGRINEFKILDDIIDFEVALSVMLSLNGQFQFEKDGFFAPGMDYDHHPDQSVEKEHNTTLKTDEKPLNGGEKEEIALGKTEDSTNTTPTKKKVKKRPVLTDEEAIEYLLENVFRKK